jgi:uncharacterized membrane protein YhhN
MQAVYFIVGFVAILLAFIFFIVFLSRKLSGNVSQRVHSLIEKITIAGILLGIVGMFQPWAHLGYRIGFHVLLFSTLAYIVWSHITPQAIRYDEEGIGDVAASESKGG